MALFFRLTSDANTKYMKQGSFHYLYVLILIIFVTGYTASLPDATASPQQDTTQNVKGKVIPDTLLFRIEKVQAEITEINAANRRGYGTDKARQELQKIRASLTEVETALQVKNPLPASKDLVNFRIMLTDIQKSSGQIRNTLTKYNSELQKRSDNIIAFSGDSLLKSEANDTTQRQLYATQIGELRQRLQQTGEVTVAHLDSVSRLLADVSAVYFSATDLQSTIDDYIKDQDRNVLDQEASYLWKAPVVDKSQTMAKMVRSSYAGQNRILRYFFNSTWDNRVILLLLVAGFFAWVFGNFRLLKKPKLREVSTEFEPQFIRPFPVLATLVVLFNLTPLFEPDSPSIYIELNQFLLLVTLSVLFNSSLDKSKIKWWYILLFLYVGIVVLNMIVNESFFLRTALILLNAFSIYTAARFYRRSEITGVKSNFIKPAIITHIAVAALSILLNVFGRLSLAKAFGITGISSVIQLLSLAAFIQVLSEAMELHMKVSACSGGLFARVNINKSRHTFKQGLTFLAIWVWVVVFLINLNLLGPVGRFLGSILEKERALGNLKFSLENILFFSVIIWLANLLQKNVGLFFGEEDADFSGDRIQKSTKLSLLRLIIFVLGFLFAITVSGVPLNKVTVLLGALGVGIGLGLQNIINNFVSGIILIFEKPFGIGDFIELADKKGKVLEIGIRSSKMLTQQGSRVIIPNGDLLSGRLVNYSTHNARLKIELTLKVHADSDMETVKRLINEIVGKGEGIVKKAPKQILFNALGADNIEIKTLVWVSDVYAEAGFRSYFLENVLQKFREKGIKLM
jgi:potassium efflux system protein